MNCFKTVLKNIAAVVGIVAVLVAFLAIIVAATVATVFVLGIDPHSAWLLAILVAYMVIGMGTVGGIAECRG